MIDSILVVDDSEPNRKVASGHLRAAGYRVLAVSSGEAALEQLGREMSDLVLLDVMMPGLGGYDTCRRIRATPAVADVPVLFLTALGDIGATQPAIDAGGDDLLAKPFNRAELLLRVRALIRQRRQARQLALQHEALRRISQMIVHDLRSPTAAILANAELITDVPGSADVAEIANDIVTSARHLESTIRALLDLSTAEDIGMNARMAELDLGELAHEVAGSLRGAGRWKDVRIACDMRGVDRIVADRELLRRMLQNLIHNAIRHAPPHTEVTVEAVADDEAVSIRILDHGPGVDPADARRIFERYVSKGSYGLGLAFCALVAELHDGKIWVDRRDPQGAIFCVRIAQMAAGRVSHVRRAPSCS